MSVTLKQIKEKIHADSYSVKGNVFTLRWGFFYTMGKTTDKYEARIREAFPNCIIVDSGEVWKPFRGGAALAQQSHFYVKFTIGDENVQTEI